MYMYVFFFIYIFTSHIVLLFVKFSRYVSDCFLCLPGDVHISFSFPSRIASGTKITCGHDQIRIDIPKSLLYNLYKEDLTLINKSCGATENSTHFSLVTSLLGCGTVTKETKDKIVYTNKVLERPISYHVHASTRYTVTLLLLQKGSRVSLWA